MTQTSSNRLLHLIKELWRHLTHRRKRQFFVLLLLMLTSAFAEVISLGAVIPFLAILASPERVMSYPGASSVMSFWGITSNKELITIFTAIFILAALLAGATRSILLWFSTKLSFSTGADLGLRVFHTTLRQPYSVHIRSNSSDVISGVINKIDNVVFGVLFPLLTIISSTVLLVAITLTLIIIEPVVTLGAVIVFGATYVLITLVFNLQLQKNSKCIAQEQTKIVKTLQEGMGGIRDIILDGTESIFSETYHRADYRLRMAQANNSFISGIPRFVMETFGVIFIAILAYGLSIQVGGIEAALPILGVLALGAQRLLPTLQQMYYAWASVVGNQASLADTISLLQSCSRASTLLPGDTAPAKLKHAIEVKNLKFRYAKDSPWILNNVSLAINKGSRIGIIGRTGSGKSTMLDVLMGLLQPTEGQLFVDGKIIDGDFLLSWQRSIAHVPQNIYLSDSTFAENIAFGVNPSSINMERVRSAARRAQIAEFIEEGSAGYDALVGERGIRLSGGQIQRIGIARAFYKQASVLVFDEATSALDNETENSLINIIQQLDNDITILIIAHRVTSLRYCDNIVEIENGQIKRQGDYLKLIGDISDLRLP